MNEVYQAALQVQDLFQRQGWKFCLIGGLAVVRWGNPRTTLDADFSLLTGFGEEDRFLDILTDELEGREPDERSFAKRFRVFRAFAPNGSSVDIALAGLPFESEMIGRASDYDFRTDCTLTTCSAEDLIVMKSFAGRDQDWADVTNVASCQWDSLDWRQVEHDLEGLCEMAENLTAVPKLQQVRQQIAAQPR